MAFKQIKQIKKILNVVNVVKTIQQMGCDLNVIKRNIKIKYKTI